MKKTLFLNPPSFKGFDGGAGARYPAKREITSYWYPTWLAQPAALTPNSKLLDCPPHDIGIQQCLEEARQFAAGATAFGSVAGSQTSDASLRNDGNTVDLESEMTALIETQLRFQAVSRLTTGKLDMLRSAIGGA